MEITTFFHGHLIQWDDAKQTWHYEDGTLIDDTPKRKCPKCNAFPTEDGHDACISNLPGVRNACCGHGQEEGYIQFNDDTVIRFKLNIVERD